MKSFLCKIFDISKNLMLNESIKVAQQATQTVYRFLLAMERGKLTFEQAYPNGVSDLAPQLVETIVAKLEAPARVRLQAVDLEKDTEFEEAYMEMRDTLCQILTLLSNREMAVVKKALQTCLNFFAQTDISSMGEDRLKLTQLYQVFLCVLEIYQRKRLSRMRPHAVDNFQEVGGNGQFAQYLQEESSLIQKIFDPSLNQVDCQLVRKSLTNLYYDLIDGECLTQEEQAIFINNYAIGVQGLQHANPIVVSHAAKLLLRLYQKTLSKWQSESALACTDSTLDLLISFLM